MNGFDAFFPSASAPRNPYRHPENGNRRFNGPVIRNRNGGGGNTLQDRIFIGIGMLVCFILFMMWKGLLSSTALNSMESITGEEEMAAAPRLRTNVDADTPSITPIPPFHMNVMTFNLRYAGASDGLNGWRYRKEHVADIINRYHPIVMGTQEGLRDQLAELKSLLTHPYECYGIERDVNGEYEQIFYDSSVVEWLEGGNFWLSETPDTPNTKGWDAACIRLVTWCKFRILATEQVFYFFNTQLDHVGEMSRTRGSRLLWQRMQTIIQKNGASMEPVVFLVGDFNTYRHTDTYRYFTQDEDGPLLYEAWPEAMKKIGSVSYTYHGWAGVDNDGERGAVVAANHIDWIFMRPSTVQVVSTEVITESRNGRYPSDHYPIQAEVIFPPASSLSI